MSRTSDYLSQMERALRNSLDETQSTEVLIEVENHLRERVQALTELGLDPEAAEYEAIKAFGDPPKLARQLVAANKPDPRVHDRPSLAVAAAATLVSAVLFAFAPWFGWYGLAVVPLALLAAPFVMSWKFGRVPGKGLFLTTVAGSLLAWVLLGTLYMPLAQFGGFGYAPRNEAARYRGFLKDEGQIRVAADRASRLAEALGRAEDPLLVAQEHGLRSGGFVLVPRVDFSLEGQVTMIGWNPVEPESARYALRDAERSLRFEADYYGGLARAFVAASRAPMGVHLLNIGDQAAILGAIWFILLLAASVAGACMHHIQRALQNIRRRRVHG